jgi:hypothetical protein
MARKANTTGIPMVWVKTPIVPENPYPPNHPKTFCAPWGKKTTPNNTRRMKLTRSFSVCTILLNTMNLLGIGFDPLAGCSYRIHRMLKIPSSPDMTLS